MTTGSIQSNHCRLTAALAAKLGFDCVLVLSGEPSSNPSGNLLLDILFNAEIRWTECENRDETLEQTFQELWEAGRRPYKIPLGASTGIGALGYFYAFAELMAQREKFDAIWVASSSGGTQAGLALAAKEEQWSGKVIGLSIDHAEAELEETVVSLANAAADRIGLGIRLVPEDVHINAEQLGGGYGVLGEQEIEAIKLFARTEGILLDPVYTGRAAAGLIAEIRSGYFAKGQNVLFWHTGGTPALFAEGYAPCLFPV